ncbi:amidohydrolase [Tropicimonas sediminicola]|uniref:Hippurate hydrolase n=1 Tax=Tropicimonas sediminicola TaxID=1031541 RepID=A0A239LDE0_9RHOB|nr:amidohydrolase [Tropicimonas sediminicola]SNT28325.1 hippurate hydrolase [Tropicimonas sediminicola]
MTEPSSIDLPRLIEIRRDLHAHPELGFEETRTAAIVAGFLRDLGLEVTEGIGGTGVVGALRNGDGRAVGLRADMDALAMPETGTPPWASTVPGKMHACGHDGHTTMLLGAAAALVADPPQGTVYFIFQPAEEGRGGAKRMVEDGLFERFTCDMVFGLHNMPGLAVDEMAVVAGPQLASSDSWRVTFRGVGTHGAKPHLGRDPVTVAGHFLAALQTIPGRVIDPLQPAVVSACSVAAGDPEALNVIPDFVEIGGTARAYSPHVRDQLETEIGQLAAGMAQAMGVRAEYRFTRRIPPVVNDAGATAVALAAAQAVSHGGVRTDFPPSTAGDDFAFFGEAVPGAYVWLGNGPAVDGALHHNTGYDFNDSAIGTGVAFWAEVARRALSA